MRLLVAAVGKLKQGPERELAERYRERAEKAGRPLGIRRIEVVETDESRARDRLERMREEGGRIAGLMPADAVVVALDGGGELVTSETLARSIQGWMERGHPSVAFAIGGPDGHGDLGRTLGLRLSFGRVTWPHQLVRIMLLEQIYRSMTILSGHPYHRA